MAASAWPPFAALLRLRVLQYELEVSLAATQLELRLVPTAEVAARAMEEIALLDATLRVAAAQLAFWEWELEQAAREAEQEAGERA